jgi:hypothetical protein
MNSLVELSEMETREVKGGAVNFVSVLTGIFTAVKNVLPAFQTFVSSIIKLF